MAYNEFAYFYDEFNGEADYDALYSHIHSQLEAHGIRFTRVPCRPELWTRRLWRAACRKRPGQWS